ncbi:MAG: ABC transporter permease [Actinomycetes bacterium]
MLLHNVFTKTLRDHRHGILGWGLGLWLMSAFEIAVYPSVRDQGERMQALVESYPAAVKAFFGLSADFTRGSGFLEAELFSLMVPLVTVAVGVGFGAGATAGEEERGTLDLLLSMPVSRRRVVLEKALAILVAITAVGAGLAVTLVVGSAWLDMGVPVGRVLTGCLSAVLLGAAFGAIALAVAAATGRRGLAAGVAVALALAAYLLHALSPLVAGLRPWRRLSPFTWYAGDGPLTHGLQADHALALVALAVAGALVGAVAFDRHDVRG